MPKITEKLEEVLEKREFVSIATVGDDGQPNSVPKFFYRGKGSFLYLLDYVVGKTIANLRENPKASISFMDLDTLEAYRLNGTARIIDQGPVFDAVLKGWNEKLVQLSTDRVIEAVRTGKRRNHYEMEMTDHLAVIKVKVESVVKIGRRGDIWKEAV
jgi:nitroimidazol reductase NimA-like FMN-containing flavoprotein (pyridoxamine 5'-phosphate oxidase superfamily)